MKITGNNDGNLGGNKSKRQQKKEKQARLDKLPDMARGAGAYVDKVNRGDFRANNHGLPAGGHITITEETGPKFREAQNHNDRKRKVRKHSSL